MLLLDDHRVVIGGVEARLDHHHEVLQVTEQLVLAGDSSHGGHEVSLRVEQRDGGSGQLEGDASLDNLHQRLMLVDLLHLLHLLHLLDLLDLLDLLYLLYLSTLLLSYNIINC